MPVGIGWLLVYYLSQSSWPIPGLGAGNVLVASGFFGLGFVLLIVGIILVLAGRGRRS